MKLTGTVLLSIIVIASMLNAKTLYVSTTGLDTNPGTIDLPLKTIAKAVTSIVAGDTILVRGGVYTFTSTLKINPVSSGKQDTLVHLYAYPGERPLLNFSGVPYGSKGIQLGASYMHIRGFDIKYAGDNGMFVSGAFNIIEFCTMSENKDSGMQLGTGANNNKVINCDSYFNRDTTEGNSDGFAPKLDVGTNNYFFGCRSWQNTDDGWDGYLRPSNNVSTTLDNCWTFMNGYRKDWSLSTAGNGNGFKMGGSDTKTLEHNFILYNCLAFDNKVKGFDQNNNKGSMTLINCSGYRNGSKNYSVVSALDSGKVLTVTNCLVYGAMGTLYNAVLTTNSWMLSDSVRISDFVSLDTSGVRGNRKPDGSLPDIKFMHLVKGSHLIDAGTIIPGRSYNGVAPDLGCFESDTTTGLKNEVNHKVGYYLSNNYPNPFNPSTEFAYQIPAFSHVTLKVYNILGKEVETLVNEDKREGTYYIKFNANNLSSGIYFYTLQTENYTQTKKMILMK
jgi:hypothetical protein